MELHCRRRRELAAPVGERGRTLGLVATRGTARSRRSMTLDELVPQEARVAHLAAEGLSNPKIAARMYVSKGTVDHHLNKVFRKPDVRSALSWTAPSRPTVGGESC